MTQHSRVFVFLILLMVIGLASPQASFAGQTNRAIAREIFGDVQYQSGGSGWRTLTVGVVLFEGDSVKTAFGSTATLEMYGKDRIGELLIREDTTFTLDTFQREEGAAKVTNTTLLDVDIGAVLIKAEKLKGESKFEVKTPTSIVGIRGTTFEVEVK